MYVDMKIGRTLAFLVFCFLLTAYNGNAHQLQKTANTIPSNYRISEVEMRLYGMINDYRRRYDLPPIPLSISLSYVASAHVRDLFFHHPDQEPCNFHSWSDKGPWKAFCYPRDENKKNSVWDEPREFTPYKDKGYEIVYWENSQVDIDSVFTLWKSVGYFNSFLMNTGKWQGTKWEAIGIGIYENYACAWFGQTADPGGPPLLEGQNPVPKEVADTVKPSEMIQDNAQEALPVVSGDSSQAATKANTAQGPPLKYYIIVRSNIPVKDVQKFIIFYTEKGYPATKSLEHEGKARISIFETFDKAEAMAKLKEVKRTYRDAWLMKN